MNLEKVLIFTLTRVFKGFAFIGNNFQVEAHITIKQFLLNVVRNKG